MNPANPSDEARPFPHALGVEKSVLSVMFQYPEMIGECPNLSESHFHIPAHRILYSKMTDAFASGSGVELVSFTQGLLASGLLDRVGGPSAISDIYNHAVNPDAFRHHVSILSEYLGRRMAILAGTAIVEAAYTNDDPQEILDATSAPITAIHDTLLSVRPTETMKNVLEAISTDLCEKLKGQKTSMGIATSIPIIDRKFRGLHRGQTTIISGYPSGGKSVLAGQFCAEAFKAGHQTLFVSLEMAKKDLAQRILSYVAGIKGMALKDPITYAMLESNGDRKTLNKGELEAIKRGMAQIAQAPFEIDHLNGASEQTIAAVIRKHHRKNPLALVAVDYAQRIRASSETRSQSREQQLSHASKVLADLAKELDFHLILLSQLNKTGEAKHAEALNEDCDTHLQIMQHKETKEHMGIAVPKDRHSGQMGALLPIKLDEEFVRFIEIDQRQPN